MNWKHLAAFTDPIAALWENGNSTHSGLNDRLSAERAQLQRHSLRFLKTDNLELSVLVPGQAFGSSKRRVQARFTHGNVDYALWVTDPVFERMYLAKADGNYMLGESFLTVSLGEPFNGDCYKLVAAIVLRSPA